MAAPPTATPVSDLHKSAFWIYGVTAMVMREPLGIVLHHASTAGWANSAVRVEALRCLVVLALMSRQFLAAGIYFDRVFLQTNAATRFPRRSYPLDFLAGMGQLLLVVGAATLVGLTTANFDSLAALILLWEPLWLAAAMILRHSTVREIAPGAAYNAAILAACAGIRAVSGESFAYGALIVLTGIQMVRLVPTYDSSQAP